MPSRPPGQSIYIENQYLTPTTSAMPWLRHWRAGRGPEVVIVLPLSCSGWLEQETMGALEPT